MKLSVEVDRDQNLAPLEIRIKKGHKKLKIKHIYGTGTDTFGFVVEGRRDDLPSLVDIFKIVDAKRLDRIGTIEKIDEVTLLKLIEQITTIKKIETIDNVAYSMTPLGSEAAPLAQVAGTGAGWVSPTGHDDVVNDWLLEANGYNDNQGNAAYSLMDFGTGWYGFLELHLAAAVQANKLRFWIFQERLGGDVDGRKVDIDVERDGSWVHVDEITDFTQKAWIERSFAQGSVTKVRFRFSNPIELETIARIYDVDVWQTATAGGELKAVLYAWTGSAWKEVKCDNDGVLSMKAV